jgi:penicillin-binding protein 2
MISGQYPSEADIAATQLGQSTVPVGPPRSIDSVPLPGATVDGAASARAGEPAGAASAPIPAPERAPVREQVALRPETP